MIKRQVDKHRATIIQFIKFGIVGAAGFVFDNALVYFGIYILKLSPVIAGLASFPFVVVFTWIGNRRFTFRESRGLSKRQQLSRFVAVCAIGLVFNRGTYSLLVLSLPLVAAYPVLGLLAGTGVGMFFNFFASKRLVFR